VTGAATASFAYDADGKQIRATVNGTSTVYIGSHYEVKNGVVSKYYFAGTTRLAVRTGATLSFQLSDHLGSSSVTTNASGAKVASALYKAFGETRYTTGSLYTDYKFTGQREESALGIYFFVARWFDPSLGRFLSPDTIVPTSTQGTQAWDRYAFVNNNPVRYNDPTGHVADETSEDDPCTYYGQNSDECMAMTGGNSGTVTTSFQMLPVFDPYYYGQAAEESYTGFSWGGGEFADPISLANDFMIGIRPSFYRHNTPYDQFVSVSYSSSYHGIPGVDAYKSTSITSLSIQNNSVTNNQGNDYFVVISGGGRNYSMTAGAGPGSAANIDLSQLKFAVSRITISISAISGVCLSPCYQSLQPQLYQGYTNLVVGQ